MNIRLRKTAFLQASWILCAATVMLPRLLAGVENAPIRNKTVRPNARPQATRGNPASIHLVKKGESLYSIAIANGTTIAAIKGLNRLRTNRLQVGWKLKIPAAGQRAAATPGVSAEVRAKLASLLNPQGDAPEQKPVALQSESTPPSAAATSEQGSESEFPSQPLRYQLANIGIGFLGVPYRWNGNSERQGFDCSGFVKCLFEKFKIDLPRSSREQFKVGEKIDKDKLEVGDLVFFSSRGTTPSHVGVYLGDNLFLHAALKAKRVLISKLNSPWYAKRFLGARRFLDLWEDDAKPAEEASH